MASMAFSTEGGFLVRAPSPALRLLNGPDKAAEGALTVDPALFRMQAEPRPLRPPVPWSGIAAPDGDAGSQAPVPRGKSTHRCRNRRGRSTTCMEEWNEVPVAVLR